VVALRGWNVGKRSPAFVSVRACAALARPSRAAGLRARRAGAQRRYYLAAPSHYDMSEWMSIIRKTGQWHRLPQARTHARMPLRGAPFCGGTGASHGYRRVQVTTPEVNFAALGLKNAEEATNFVRNGGTVREVRSASALPLGDCLTRPPRCAQLSEHDADDVDISVNVSTAER
jgi:hypothetical protein